MRYTVSRRRREKYFKVERKGTNSHDPLPSVAVSSRFGMTLAFLAALVKKRLATTQLRKEKQYKGGGEGGEDFGEEKR